MSELIMAQTDAGSEQGAPETMFRGVAIQEGSGIVAVFSNLPSDECAQQENFTYQEGVMAGIVEHLEDAADPRAMVIASQWLGTMQGALSDPDVYNNLQVIEHADDFIVDGQRIGDEVTDPSCDETIARLEDSSAEIANSTAAFKI